MKLAYLKSNYSKSPMNMVTKYDKRKLKIFIMALDLTQVCAKYVRKTWLEPKEEICALTLDILSFCTQYELETSLG